ncbi:MAG: hypothetical protein RMJ98_16445 [Myxococcales bacterium]|nr:hypothetical protein [Myxococcales bacterium]
MLLLASCKDISSYSTAPDESYCGSVVQGPFVRAGLSPSVQMRLTFDAEALDRSPGKVSTSDGLLKEAPLQVVPQIFHDPLSTLEFGEGRRRNLIYSALPANGGSAVVVILSLMESGDAEVRLLRAAPAEQGGGGDEAIFGVFPLKKRRGTCGL